MKTNKKEKENKRYRYGQTALHILVLNSPTTNCAQLRSAIESEKCKVSVVSTAHPEEWSNLDLRAFNVIVYAPDDRTVLDNAFQRRVKTFVYEGGGLVLFEWVAFHIEHRRLTHWADFVPIQRRGSGIAGTQEFQVLIDHHPITAELPSQFIVLGGFSIPAISHRGVPVIACGQSPGVVCNTFGQGHIVHINCCPYWHGMNAFLYTSFQQLYFNSVMYTATACPGDQSTWLQCNSLTLRDADIILESADGKQLKVHRALLKVRIPSLYHSLKRFLLSESDENKEKVFSQTSLFNSIRFEFTREAEGSKDVKIIFPNANGPIVSLFVQYLYTERLDVVSDDFEFSNFKLAEKALDLIDIAVDCNLPYLQWSAMRLVRDLWSMKTILKICRKLHFPNFLYLKKPALEFIVRHYKQLIVDTEGLMALDKEFLVDMMQAHVIPQLLDALPTMKKPPPSLPEDLKKLYQLTHRKTDCDFILRFPNGEELYAHNFFAELTQHDLPKEWITKRSSRRCLSVWYVETLSFATLPDTPVSNLSLVSPTSDATDEKRDKIENQSSAIPLPSLPLTAPPSLSSTSSLAENVLRLTTAPHDASADERNKQKHPIAHTLAHLSAVGSLRLAREATEDILHRYHSSHTSNVHSIFPADALQSEESPVREINLESGMIPTITAMKSFLQYLYTNEIVIAPEDSLYFLDATETYGLPDDTFERSCRRIFESGLSHENVFPTLLRAHSLQNEFVKEAALEYIIKHFNDISISNSLQTLSRDLVTELLQKVSEYNTSSGSRLNQQ